MKITTLIENNTIDKKYKAQHGLSLYIQTINHHILFDTGANQSFIANAEAMGVDLSIIDICIISHGHYDHGGGLEAFLAINNKAKVYIHKQSFDKHNIRMLKFFYPSIGIKASLKEHPQIHLIEDDFRIDENMIIFQNKEDGFRRPKGNQRLLAYDGSQYRPDSFDHEINLLITEDKPVIVCGCAHNGIVNIINSAKRYTSETVDKVIGGFHISRYNVDEDEDKAYIDSLKSALLDSNVNNFYTCHCTGNSMYHYMSENTDRIKQIKTGVII